MSLINQMLKDLDARHGDDARARLHREVRALPTNTGNKTLQLLIVALLALSFAAAAWWGYEHYLAGRGAASSAPALPSPVPVPAGPAPSPAPVESGQTNSTTVDINSGLKLSASLDKMPESEPAAPKAALPSPRRVAQQLPVGDAMPAPKTSQASAVAKEAPAGQVERTPVVKSVREGAESEYRRALSLANGNRAQEATDVLLDVLRKDGTHAASRHLLARLLIEQRRYNEAMAILAEGLVAQPGQVAWAMTLARLQVDQGDLAGAARSLQQSQSFAAGNADYLGFSGHVQHRLGHQKESIDFYQAAVRLAPAEGRWWFGLGLALEADQRLPEAREAFMRARASGSLNADLSRVVDQKLH